MDSYTQGYIDGQDGYYYCPYSMFDDNSRHDYHQYNDGYNQSQRDRDNKDRDVDYD